MSTQEREFVHPDIRPENPPERLSSLGPQANDKTDRSALIWSCSDARSSGRS